MEEIWQTENELSRDIQSVLVTTEQLQQRVAALGQAISRDYQGKDPVLVGALKGVICFMADLLRTITIPMEVDFIAISSYSAEAREQGVVRMVKDLDRPITGRHVVFIEDVVDTGLTLNYLMSSMRARQPASLEVCALFDKNYRRLINLPIRYKGFDIPDYFVVGYGLDYRDRYRNLPYVGVLKPEVLFTPDKKKRTRQG